MRRLLLALLLLACLLPAGCSAPPAPPARGALVLPEALALQGKALLVGDPGASALWRLALPPSSTLERVQGEPVGPDFVMPGGMAPLPDGAVLVTGMGRGLCGLVRAGPGPGFALLEGPGPEWRLPLGVATDGRKAWVADSLAGRVVEVDLASGRRRSFGPPFRTPAAVALREGILWVSDPDAGRVTGLDAATGRPGRTFDGLALPTALAAPEGGALLVLEGGGLTRLDSGKRLADGFGQAVGLASDGRRAWVSDAARGMVLEVDLASGASHPVASRLSGTPAYRPDHLAVLDEASTLVTGGGLHRVDLRDGSRTPVPAEGLVRPFGVALLQGKPVLTDPGRAAVMTPEALVSAFGLRGRGPRLVEPEAITPLPDGTLAVSDIATGAVLRVDPSTGDRSLITGVGRGGGPSLGEPSALAMLDGTLVVADLQEGALLLVDPASGDRRLAASGLKSPGALAASEGGVFVADDGRHAVFHAAPPEWKLREVAGPGRGRGPALEYPSGLALLRGGHLAAADHRTGLLLEIRPETGDRRVVEPLLVSPGALLAREGRALVADSGFGGLVEVDLGTGRRSSYPVKGTPLREPEGLASLPRGVLVADLVLRGLAVVGADGHASPVAAEGLSRPAGLAARGEEEVLVADSGLPGLVLVNLATGKGRRLDREGPEFVEPLSVVFGPEGPVAADPAVGVVAVDPAGLRRLLVRGGEPLAVVRVGDRILYLDGASGEIRDVEGPLVSRWGARGEGPPLLEPSAAVLAGGGLLVTDAGQGALFRVDPETGRREVVSQGWPVAEKPPPLPAALAPGPGGELWMAEAVSGRLLVLDSSGRARPLPLPPLGRPTALEQWKGRPVVADSDRETVGVPGRPPLLRGVRCEGLALTGDGSLLATDRMAGRLLRLRPGGRPEPLGPPLLGAAGVVALPGNRAAVLDEREACLHLVDLSSGQSRVVSGAGRGKGPEFEYPSHLAVLADGALVVADEGGRFLLRVDPDTGERSVLSGPGRGRGPGLERPRAVLARQGRLVVADAGLGALLEVDPATGDRRVLWPGEGAGGLPSPGPPP